MNIRYIQDILDSDDELPLEYVETPEIPAYLRDDRFDFITNNGNDQKYDQYHTKKDIEIKTESNTYFSTLCKNFFSQTANLKPGEKCLIFDAVMTKQDLYCLQCIEPSLCDTKLLWLFNFFIYKDIQLKYSFLRPCLVNTMPYKVPPLDVKYKPVKKFQFEFAV